MKIDLKKKIGSVFLILVITAIAELLTNVILGRNLSADIFGRFKFINTIVVMMSSLLLLGQNMAIIRVFGKDSFGKYNWKKFISSCLFFSAFIGILVISIISFYYKFSKEGFFIYIAFISIVGIEYFSSLRRARGSYTYSMFLSKSASIGFFLIVAVAFYFTKNIGLYLLLFVYTAVIAFSFIASILSVKKFECGKEKVPLSVVKEGLWLFLITISFTIMVQIDQFFIAKMLNYEKLASYVVIITVTRGYDLIAAALWFVMMPQYSKDLGRSIKSDSIKAGLIGFLISIFYIFFGGILVHFLFKGLYDQSLSLLKFFIVIGFCRILYSIPSGIIGGRLSTKHLKFFLATCLIGIAINIGGNYYLIPIMGLSGSAIATMASWIFRLASAYIIIYREKNNIEITKDVVLA